MLFSHTVQQICIKLEFILKQIISNYGEKNRISIHAYPQIISTKKEMMLKGKWYIDKCQRSTH